MEIKKEIKRDGYAVKITINEGKKEMARGFLYLIYNDLHSEPYGFMEDIFVDESVRHQGLGNKILERLIAEAKERGCYKLLGTTRHSKRDVQRWYERHGFRNFGLELRMDLKK